MDQLHRHKSARAGNRQPSEDCRIKKRNLILCETSPFADMAEDSSWIMLNMYGGRSSEMLVLMYKSGGFHMPENWTLY